MNDNIPKLQIAFFRASEGALDDKFIDYFSGGDGYSHCEVVVNKHHMIGSHYLHNGVANFYYQNIYRNPKWDIFELDIPRTSAVQSARSYLGRPYDALGVVLFFIGVQCCDSEHGVWCSELCSCVINEASKSSVIKDCRIMPNDLVRWMLKQGAKLVNKPSTLEATDDTFITPIDRFGRISEEAYKQYIIKQETSNWRGK